MQFEKDEFRDEIERAEEHSKRRRAENPSSHDEDMSEYDKTLADSFPASDPPSH